ncbi:GAF domain protein [Magnetococcus marinus MC-1]|uniref:GAF domain protein n=1 Tax=Magnetococcus marinus (strain ATCC BAA-1437 / JCM 17883 / MC-1) TaxID=156889 RepID=A0L9N5_MAGMM|nr:HlyD family efflux transporter periplasmic adaptor subunit [Magnetococcus marinus]ABK44678.1 GAF domain protein [Magnetococcus marinus MC-1]
MSGDVQEWTTDLWQQLHTTHDDAQFIEVWMHLLARQAGSVTQGVLVMGEANSGPFLPVAFWPPQKPCGAALAAACEQAMEMRLPLTRQSSAGGVLAVPIIQDMDLLGVVGLGFQQPAVPAQAKLWIQWGLGWLWSRGNHGAEAGSANSALNERLMRALNLMMSALEAEKAQDAYQITLTEAAVELGCDRVSLGFGKGGMVRFAALSHSADFSKKIDLVQDLEAAMNEAADQGLPVLYRREKPQQLEQDESTTVVREHRALAQQHGNRVLFSVPFFVSEEQYGVFLYEWSDDEVDATAQQLAMGLPPILGRVLLEKRESQRPLLQRVGKSIGHWLEKLLGAGYVGLKLWFIALLATGLFFTLATGMFRVAADAKLEGAVQRVVAAPFDGFVATASVRAGQYVQEGELLATLDDREIALELSRWENQQIQFLKQAQDAQAQHNSAQVRIALSQAKQAAAQRDLAQEKLRRAQLTAPFAGLVVRGDLSQRLGSAVQKGEMLFELAPLASYRVVLQVEEADIAQVESGQQGELILTALPNDRFPIKINLITPVAVADQGTNRFRVEAELLDGVALVRPGMEGVGKIEIEERRLLWIWTRRFVDWLRLKAWTWLGV